MRRSCVVVGMATHTEILGIIVMDGTMPGELVVACMTRHVSGTFHLGGGMTTIMMTVGVRRMTLTTTSAAVVAVMVVLRTATGEAEMIAWRMVWEAVERTFA